MRSALSYPRGVKSLCRTHDQVLLQSPYFFFFFGTRPVYRYTHANHSTALRRLRLAMAAETDSEELHPTRGVFLGAWLCVCARARLCVSTGG